MQKLPAVEEAKALFADARHWSMWRWLTEKGRARSTADAAWLALEQYEDAVRAEWPGDLKKAWKNGRTADAEVEKLREADAVAAKARDDAEAHFDEAGRRMSTSMACEGAQMAIDAWEMREKVIRKAEALGKRRQ